MDKIKVESVPFSGKLYELTELEFLTIEAYSLAINKIENIEYKLKLGEFKNHHERHLCELIEILKNHHEKYPQGPKFPKKWFVKGEILIANLADDEEILEILRKNETESNNAYKNLSMQENQWIDAIDIIHKGLSDERRHKEWIESILD